MYILQMFGIALIVTLHKLMRKIAKDEERLTMTPGVRRRYTDSTKLSPRAAKKKYPYFDDDFDEQWGETGL